MVVRSDLIEAIRASWSRDTSATPDQWMPSNPARGQCDVTAFVAWEYLEGELVLGDVSVDGVFTEHHYWNRTASGDLDLTRGQFTGGEVIAERAVLDSEYLTTHITAMKPEVAHRIAVFRDRVAARLNREI